MKGKAAITAGSVLGAAYLVLLAYLFVGHPPLSHATRTGLAFPFLAASFVLGVVDVALRPGKLFGLGSLAFALTSAAFLGVRDTATVFEMQIWGAVGIVCLILVVLILTPVGIIRAMRGTPDEGE